MTTTQLTSGTELGRYELLVPIAKGGMAQVWAGRLRGTRGFSKLVAIKTILPGGIDNERLEQMFLEEASLAAQIHHPNVVETLELGEHEGTLYLVMEWVDGESLDYLHRRANERGGLPLSIAVQVIGQVCKGLHAAHELQGENAQLLGLVHRDISPQNVLVTYTGTAKLVDFGIAKATGRSSSLTDAGELKGKVAYMSPEQIKGQPLDRRTDVFALGVLLYSLTTGKHPFRGANPAETIRRICLQDPAAPESVVAGYPPLLAEVVLKALKREPSERIESAQALLGALQEAVPEAFESSFERRVVEFLEGLVGERARERRAALRLAQEAVAKSKGHESYSSLRAISIDRTGEGSGSSRSNSVARASRAAQPIQEELPLGKPRFTRLVAAAAAVCATLVLAGVASVLLRTPSPASPSAAPAHAAQPVPVATLSAFSSAPVASTSAQPTASADAERPAARNRALQRRRGAAADAAPRALAPRASASVVATDKAAKPDAWDPSSFGQRQ